MSSQSEFTRRKTPWLLRFANLYSMKVRHMFGADMQLWQYNNRELLQTAEMAHWMNDERWANYVMEELALRIIEEHPPDGERMEIEIEEGSKETGSADEERETDYDSLCFERGRD